MSPRRRAGHLACSSWETDPSLPASCWKSSVPSSQVGTRALQRAAACLSKSQLRALPPARSQGSEACFLGVHGVFRVNLCRHDGPRGRRCGLFAHLPEDSPPSRQSALVWGSGTVMGSHECQRNESRDSLFLVAAPHTHTAGRRRLEPVCTDLLIEGKHSRHPSVCWKQCAYTPMLSITCACLHMYTYTHVIWDVLPHQRTSRRGH